MTIRIFTAVIGISALIAVLAALMMALAVASGWELADMVRARRTCPLRWFLLAWPISLIAAGWLIAEDVTGWWVMLVAFLTGTVPAIGILLTGRRTAFVYAIAAGPYVGIALAHTPILRSVDGGVQWLALAVIVTFAAGYARGINCRQTQTLSSDQPRKNLGRRRRRSHRRCNSSAGSRHNVRSRNRVSHGHRTWSCDGCNRNPRRPRRIRVQAARRGERLGISGPRPRRRS